MVTSLGTQAASGARGGCWSTKAHCLRRGRAVAHATTEFEVLTSLLLAFQLRPVGSGNGRNTDVRTCHSPYVLQTCRLRLSVSATGPLDAWAPSIYPWSQLATGVERLREGAARGGHPDRLPEIPVVPTVVADTEAKAREGAAWFVSFYVTAMGTVYRDSLTRQGYGKAVEAVLAANAPKLTGVVPADAEELLEQLTVYGTPPEARRRLRRWHEAGAAFPVLLLRPNLTPEERALTLEAFRPMLQSA